MSFVLGRLKPISESPACRFGLIMRHVDSDGGKAARPSFLDRFGLLISSHLRSLPARQAAELREIVTGSIAFAAFFTFTDDIPLSTADGKSADVCKTALPLSAGHLRLPAPRVAEPRERIAGSIWSASFFARS